MSQHLQSGVVVVNQLTFEYFISSASMYPCYLSELVGRWQPSDTITVALHDDSAIKSLKYLSLITFDGAVSQQLTNKPPPPMIKLITMANQQNITWAGLPYQELLRQVRW